MNEKFRVIFLEEAKIFLDKLHAKSREKILFNIRKAQLSSDPDLFKKLTGEIWEFRTLYNKTCFRLFAFWDKSDKQQTVVITTHGIIKKTSKTPGNDLQKAESLRLNYFQFKKQ